MLIIGSRGHAVEIMQCIKNSENIEFFDDMNDQFYDNVISHKICRNLKEAENHLSIDNRFVLGLGNPILRQSMADKFIKIGGVLTTVTASSAVISEDVFLGTGLNIMHFSLIAPNVKIGMGTLVNARVSIHHDVEVGDFCEISPGATLLGRSKIGNRVNIGAGAIILPNIVIDNDAIVGAGAVVTKNVAKGSLVVGIPAQKK